jgi:hypothetical protein
MLKRGAATPATEAQATRPGGRIPIGTRATRNETLTRSATRNPGPTLGLSYLAAGTGVAAEAFAWRIASALRRNLSSPAVRHAVSQIVASISPPLTN